MTAPAPGARPLAGVRVLDLTRLLPGPYCTLLLADLGADVIKVEDPKSGDFVRWVPPLVGAHKQMGAAWVALHRGKRSLCLSTRDPKARDAFLRLVETADVLVEGFRPGAMERAGIGVATLHARNPRLVVCSISGYGQDGPYRDRAGHDIDYLALSGLLGQTGSATDHPAPPGFQVGDIGGGALMAALRIVAALHEQDRTGRGSWIDVSMTEGGQPFVALSLAGAVAGAKAPGRGRDQLSGGLACYAVYETGDGGHMALGALEPKFWAAFCVAVGRPDWASRQYEGAGQPETSPIAAEVRALFKQRTRAAWEALFADHDCCCEPVLAVDEVLSHPANAARMPMLSLEHPVEGPMTAVRSPALDAAHAAQAGPPPLLGEHTRAVLLEAGLTDDAIDDLIGGGLAKQA